MFENCKKLMDCCQESGVPALDLIVYHQGKEVYRDVRGTRDYQGTLPLLGNEKYNIYSCSKVVTVAAALQLLEAGKIRLTDNLADYIPAFADVRVGVDGDTKKAENKITLYHLFTMTSGIQYLTNHPQIQRAQKDTDGKCPTVIAMDYIAKIPLLFHPGESWKYGFNHDILGAVIEIVTGMPFGEYVKRNIFDVCGATSATFLQDESNLDGLCAQFEFHPTTNTFVDVGKKIQYYRLGSEFESGGAGITCTVQDYIRFLEAMRTHKIISPESVRQLNVNQLKPGKQTKVCWVEEGYGYGLGVRTPLPQSKRTDYGWGGAAGAMASIDEQHGITMFYAQHVLESPAKAYRKDFIEAVKLDLGYPAFTESMYHGEGNALA